MIRKYTKSKSANKEKLQRDDFHDEELVSVKVAAEILGMSVPFIKKWTGKQIPFYKIGASTRFKVADLKAFLESRRVETSTG